jgi:anti-sigma B factor antagonist
MTTSPEYTHAPEEPIVETGRLETEVRRTGDCPVLAIKGEIDVYSAPDFKQAVVGLIDDGTRHVILDMSDVTYMDSSGFSTLLSATKRLRPEGGALHLVGTRPTVQRILHLTRLDTVLELHPDVDDALQATERAAAAA